MRRARIKAVANVPARRKVDENKTQKSDEIEKNETTSNDNTEKQVSIETISSEVSQQDVPEKSRSRIRAVAKIPIRRNKNTETDKPVTDDVTANESNFVKPDENENTSVVRPSPVTSPIVQHRPRIRSIPRLDGHHRGSDRRNSTSASESEDEFSRRNIRNRYDSVNSNSSSNIVSDSTPLNTLTTINTPTINGCNNSNSPVVKEICSKTEGEVHKNVLSPNKNNVSNKESMGVTPGGTLSQQSNIQQIQQQQQQQPIIKRKVRRSDIAKKMAEAKRDFYNKFGTKTPDRQKLTMMDLIFYNPTSNPMLKKTPASSTSSRKKSEQIDSSSSVASFNDNESVHSMSTRAEEETVDEPEEETMQPVPQVKIGENGEIILDEQSVVIETTDQQIQRMNKSRELTETAINYDELNTTYGIYKRAKRTKDWSVHETKQFYRVLQMIGTDFSMMLSYFKNRTRRDLKLKFKKEEKINRHLIDKVLLNPCTFDLEQLQQSLDQDQQLLDEQQLNQKQIQEIKRQDQMQRKRKTNEKRVRYKTGSWLARQMYVNKSDMMQDFDEDDPPPTVVPSIEVSNATPTVEADPQLDKHNPIDSNPSIEAPNQNLKDNNSKAEEPPLKKCKYSYEEEQDELEDDETSKLVTAMFGKETTTRCGRKIRSKLTMKNDNVPETDNDEFIIPHHQEEISNFKNKKERIITEKQIISNNNQKERIRSDNQEERILPDNEGERILPDNQEERILPDNEVESIPPDNQKKRMRSGNQEERILPDNEEERIPSNNQKILSDDQEKKNSEAKRITPDGEIKVPDSQQEKSINNQEINFEEVLYQNIQDNLEENIRKLMEGNQNNEDDNDDDNDSDSHLVIDLNNTNNDEDNTKLNNNNNNSSEAKLNNLLEDYLGSNQTITLELPVVTGDSTEQFKVIIELTSDSDEIVTEDQ
ncbi:transcription factor TFIIIB component B'' homolog [Chrysoperla carnea]|uniref:transcription factor TFIIIB component B'' homolog n=1 Tax=Chrysoperla carnea TaxID=189513 RepID=UPI001D05FE63|nr:transcription factor TFIIIB component B'' homolog [Chrysoperla carnea]